MQQGKDPNPKLSRDNFYLFPTQMSILFSIQYLLSSCWRSILAVGAGDPDSSCWGAVAAAGAAGRSCAAVRTDCEGIQRSRSAGDRGRSWTAPTRTRRNSKLAGQPWTDAPSADAIKKETWKKSANSKNKNQCCGSGSGAFLTPGSGIRNRLFPDPGYKVL